MSYVVTIFTEKHLYRVNIEEGTKYTIGSGEKDAFPMSELGVDGQLGICFHAKKQILKLNAKKIPLSVKEMKEEAKLVNICEFPGILENIQNHILFLMSVRFISEDLKKMILC